MDYYGEMAASYDSLHREEQEKKLAIIRSKLAIKKEDRMLDVGCGTGFSREFFSCVWQGLEPSKDMAGKRKDIAIGSAEKIPFEDSSFDIVISVTAIHNFTDIAKGLLEMRRVGKRDYAFSILKKAKSLKRIEIEIEKLFDVKEKIDEGIDIIFICSKK